MNLAEDVFVRPRVLIVDDEPSQIMVVRASIGDAYDISFSTSAAEAFELCHQYPQPDIILMDIMMPECDGFQLCSMLKADSITYEIPIIFVSANSDPDEMAKGFTSGCVDYLVKPVRPAEIQARLMTHLRLNKQTRTLEMLAYQDPLTKLANRRRLNETLMREWARCARYHQPLSLVLIDLDNFKTINDSFGHQVGDEALESLADVLQQIVHRPGDIVARVGGDEFAIVFSDFEPNAAKVKLAEIQSKVARIPPLTDENTRHEITISMGACVIFPDATSDPLFAFQQADNALYQSKKNGRNQFTITQSLPIDGFSSDRFKQVKMNKGS